MCRPTVIALTHKRTLGIYKFLQDKAHMLRASLLTKMPIELMAKLMQFWSMCQWPKTYIMLQTISDTCSLASGLFSPNREILSGFISLPFP